MNKMKKYITPVSEEFAMQMESVIATSLPKNDEGTDAAPLSNHRGGWSMEDWNGEEE